MSGRPHTRGTAALLTAHTERTARRWTEGHDPQDVVPPQDATLLSLRKEADADTGRTPEDGMKGGSPEGQPRAPLPRGPGRSRGAGGASASWRQNSLGEVEKIFSDGRW